MRPIVFGFALGSATQALSAQQPAPPVSMTQSLVIDGTANHLTRIGWVGVSPHGTIAILQPSDHAVRFFGKDGAALGVVGKQGEGPGEFARMGAAGWLGDTLWVNDPTLHRITFISPKLVIRTVHSAIDLLLKSGDPAPFYPSAAADGPTPVAMNSDGSFLVSATLIPGGSVPATWRRPVNAEQVVARASAAGMFQSTVAWTPAGTGCSIPYGSGGSYVRVPLCATPLRALAADGHLIAVANPVTTGADSGTIGVAVIGSRADTVFSKRYPFTATPVSRHDADSIIQRYVNAFGARAPEAVATLRSIHLTIYPPLESMLVGRDGTIWIERKATTAGRPWLVLDLTGIPWGTVTAPNNVSIRVADRATAFAVRTDEQGAESLVRYQLKR